MQVLLTREQVSPSVAENSYAVFLSPRDDPFGDYTRRFSWQSATAVTVGGTQFETWQAARAAAKQYAKALAERLGAELIID